MTIASELKRLRTIKGVSLRKVESETGVSNAYLSQLERGVTKNPSPHVLHKLADFYETSYRYLLKLAGYLGEKSDLEKRKVADVESALMSANLSEDQEEMIVNFIEFIKSKNQ